MASRPRSILDPLLEKLEGPAASLGLGLLARLLQHPQTTAAPFQQHAACEAVLRLVVQAC